MLGVGVLSVAVVVAVALVSSSASVTTPTTDWRYTDTITHIKNYYCSSITVCWSKGHSTPNSRHVYNKLVLYNTTISGQWASLQLSRWPSNEVPRPAVKSACNPIPVVMQSVVRQTVAACWLPLDSDVQAANACTQRCQLYSILSSI